MFHDLVEVCNRLYFKGFVSATDGNVSARLENGNFLTTRSGINKGMVTEDDILEVDNNGNIVIRNPQSAIRNHKPSTEFRMHLFIYQQRPDVNAVVHAHPIYATGFAAARVPLTSCVFPEVIVGLGAVPLAEYATPSTEEVALSIAPFVKQTDAILLANHGVVTYGRDLWDAYYKMEKVEHAAHITFVAKMLGGEKLLSQEEIEKLRAISQQSYGKEITDKISCVVGEENTESSVDVRKVIRQMLDA
ncbi:MAG: class II aldolase/adducin family protein [Ignavibacteriae bacterium]|nr:class II aldolase/adducin family protein [Ignavibacteriota bacterium]